MLIVAFVCIYDTMLFVYINGGGLTLSYHCYTLCGNGALW